MAYVLALQSAYGSACKIWAMPTAGPHAGRRASGAGLHHHFSVVDREGNMGAVTQTLLSTFGSKYVLQQSGVP